MEKIFKVTTEGDCEGKTIRILGYCTGHPGDIRDYYMNDKAYEISVELIEVKHISPADVTKKADLLQRKQQLETELAYINKVVKLPY